MPKIMLENFFENRLNCCCTSSIFLAITFKHFSGSEIFLYSGYMKLLHSGKLLQLQFRGNPSRDLFTRGQSSEGIEN
jgi:hypothetical protein